MKSDEATSVTSKHLYSSSQIWDFWTHITTKEYHVAHGLCSNMIACFQLPKFRYFCSNVVLSDHFPGPLFQNRSCTKHTVIMYMPDQKLGLQNFTLICWHPDQTRRLHENTVLSITLFYKGEVSWCALVSSFTRENLLIIIVKLHIYSPIYFRL